MIAIWFLLMVLGRVGGHIGRSRVSQALSFLQGSSLEMVAAPKVAFGAAKSAVGKILLDAGVPEAETSARYLTAHAIGRVGDSFRISNSEELAPLQLVQLREFLQRRLQREPVQYIVGDWDFHLINLRMRAPVLVPRPETEDLVERILTFIAQQNLRNGRIQILDIGSGTGAIGLALLKQLPKATCLAVDVNEVAVTLSEENAEHVGVSDRYACVRGDITSCSTDRIDRTHDISSGLLKLRSSSFDLIVSNPPYIPADDMRTLEPEVAAFEDFGALCGGEDGLNVARSIVRLLPELFRTDEASVHEQPSAWFELDDSHLTGKHTLFEDVVGHESSERCKVAATYQDPFGKPRFARVMPTSGK